MSTGSETMVLLSLKPNLCHLPLTIVAIIYAVKMWFLFKMTPYKGINIKYGKSIFNTV